MKTKVLKFVATAVGLFAIFSVTTASFFWGNQPNVPSELLEK
ncbi:cyclic lactone autoinducer peptide [Paenibacillus solisilvae]|uniref:Cyclic lactone autoinducer peptide n=1 Tax=Paenibacillus solisilvae TaxID=2486751 RepID=A0ABW0W500_9BACL